MVTLTGEVTVIFFSVPQLSWGQLLNERICSYTLNPIALRIAKTLLSAIGLKKTIAHLKTGLLCRGRGGGGGGVWFSAHSHVTCTGKG